MDVQEVQERELPRGMDDRQDKQDGNQHVRSAVRGQDVQDDEQSREMGESRIEINPRKKRGPGRVKLTLGGRKKLEKAAKSKQRKNLNRQLGRAGMMSKNESKNPATGKMINTKKKSSNIPTEDSRKLSWTLERKLDTELEW